MKQVLFVLVFILLCALTRLASAQTVDVRSNANLRAGPSSSEPAIRKLTPPETVTLLGLRRINRYYQVQTDADEIGWIFGSLLDLQSLRIGVEIVRNVNLRPTPGSSEAPVRLMLPPETAELESLDIQNRYYHIRTETNEVGFVWGPNVRVINLDDPPGEMTTLNYPDARGSPPSDWSGHIFQLSQDFPKTLPPIGAAPYSFPKDAG